MKNSRSFLPSALTMNLALITFSSLITLTPSFAQENAKKDPTPNWTLKNDSEVGLILTGGNSNSQTYSFGQKTAIEFYRNTIMAKARYLKTDSKGTEQARQWGIGLRYERELLPRFSLFAGQSLDSDIFAGFLQRHMTDAGTKFVLLKDQQTNLFLEAGYRFTIENQRFPVTQLNQHFFRGYAEGQRAWNPTLTTKLWLEILPNFTNSNDWQFNGEASVIATLSGWFAIKTAYLGRFRNQPAPGVSNQLDSAFTASVIAHFETQEKSAIDSAK